MQRKAGFRAGVSELHQCHGEEPSCKSSEVKPEAVVKEKYYKCLQHSKFFATAGVQGQVLLTVPEEDLLATLHGKLYFAHVICNSKRCIKQKGSCCCTRCFPFSVQKLLCALPFSVPFPRLQLGAWHERPVCSGALLPFEGASTC